MSGDLVMGRGWGGGVYRKGDSQLVPLLYELLSNSVWGRHPVEIANLFGFSPFEKLRENNPHKLCK